MSTVDIALLLEHIAAFLFKDIFLKPYLEFNLMFKYFVFAGRQPDLDDTTIEVIISSAGLIAGRMRPLSIAEATWKECMHRIIPYMLLNIEKFAAIARRNNRERVFWIAMACLPGAICVRPPPELALDHLRSTMIGEYGTQEVLDVLMNGFETITKLVPTFEDASARGRLLSAALGVLSLHIVVLCHNDKSLTATELALDELVPLINTYLKLHEELGATGDLGLHAFTSVSVACEAIDTALHDLGHRLGDRDCLKDAPESTAAALLTALSGLSQLLCAVPQWTDCDKIFREAITYPIFTIITTAIPVFTWQLGLILEPICKTGRHSSFPWDLFRVLSQRTAKTLMHSASIDSQAFGYIFYSKPEDLIKFQEGLEESHLLQPQAILDPLRHNTIRDSIRGDSGQRNEELFEELQAFMPALILQVMHALEQVPEAWKTTYRQRYEVHPLELIFLTAEAWWAALEPRLLGTEPGLLQMCEYLENSKKIGEAAPCGLPPDEMHLAFLEL